MVYCWVPRCNHRGPKNGCELYQLPENKKLLKKWLFAVRRSNGEINRFTRICSCHFRNGDIRNIPSIFSWNVAKRFDFVSPEKRKRNKFISNKLRSQNPESEHLPQQLSFEIENLNVEQASVFLPGPSTTDMVMLDSSVAQSSSYSPESSNEDIIIGKTRPISIHTQTECSTTCSSTQTEHQFSPMFYEADIYFKDRELELLKKEAQKNDETERVSIYKLNDSMCIHYTSFNLATFRIICSTVEKAKWNYAGSNVIMFSVADQLLITLMTLRRNFSRKDLAFRFKCSIMTISKVFHSILTVLHEILFKTCMKEIPSVNKNNMSLPDCFSSFHNCRVVLDCSEISCEVPDNLAQQRATYSSYKARNTLKVLIGMAPIGVITYCSNLYPGSTSDRDIVHHCGILQQMQPGDLILADKGFRISDILPKGVNLNVPPFLMHKKFTPAEVHETNRIAKARVHVERIIQRLKLFKILDRIPHTLFPVASKIVQVCAALVNFQSPILHEMEKNFDFVHRTTHDEIENILVDD